MSAWIAGLGAVSLLCASTVSTEDGLVDFVLDAPDAGSLARWHEQLGSEPHVAGSAGDHRVIASIAESFEAMGLDTEVWWFEPLLPKPVKASLTILDDAPPPAEGRRRGIRSLALTERELLADPATAHPDLTWGWNAYSASGEVEGEVVYANRGRIEDFRRLKELGVDLTGKIVLARYGGNYRGYKAKFAQEAGAAGLLMYLDPADYGDGRGPTWPTGGWANETCIQRGSILTLPYKGDPLTPFQPAVPGVERLPIEEVGLPEIPVQPIGYAAAERIMRKMTGQTVPDEDWVGGIDVPYRLDGGELKLRLVVEQERSLGRTANVLGLLRGKEQPEQLVIVGCHHDAWGFGAADPLAGTIVLMETARAFAEAARAGIHPRRSVLFAAWGAEEFGIIGSSEWCEANAVMLDANAVAYINLDMAAMGNGFGASATPSLRNAILKAAELVPQAGNDELTVLEAWSERGQPSMGVPGGGSDHVGFNLHLGIPSCGLHSGGSEGTAYHSNYDTLAWYRRTVGEDYAPALMLSRICGALAGELADAPVVPLDPTAVVVELHQQLPRFDALARERLIPMDLVPLEQALVRLAEAATAVRDTLAALPEEDPRRAEVNRQLVRLERNWTESAGMPGRPWYRNLLCGSNRYSGYGSVRLPLLAEAIDDRDPKAVQEAVERYRTRIEALTGALRRLSAALESR
ncbi:MAG: M28 family peptidase [Phycisphaerales bacterium]|nr:M28 family peptidase [Phycisphaerales bacterium]